MSLSAIRKGACHALLFALVAIVSAACAGDRSAIGSRIEAMTATRSASGEPTHYVEMFPGGGENCGYTARDARVWNTHPVRAIKASFARILPGGGRDYVAIDIPAGEIMTVEQCTAGQPELIAAQFIDQS